MGKTKQKEKILSEKEKEEIDLFIKKLQKNCKHEQGYITNTKGPSVCILCGKSWN